MGVLIPLNLDDFMFDPEWQGSHKTTLTRRVAAEFRNWGRDDEYESQLRKVVQALGRRRNSTA